MRTDTNAMREAIRSTLQDGGATIGPSGPIHPTNGYAVAIVGDTYATVPASVDPAALGRVVRRLRRQYPDAYVGTWHDGERIHVDPVEVIDNRADAERIGRERSQLAIFNFATRESIYLA